MAGPRARRRGSARAVRGAARAASVGQTGEPGRQQGRRRSRGARAAARARLAARASVQRGCRSSSCVTARGRSGGCTAGACAEPCATHTSIARHTYGRIPTPLLSVVLALNVNWTGTCRDSGVGIGDSECTGLHKTTPGLSVFALRASADKQDPAYTPEAISRNTPDRGE